jgi:heme/copper-type cytochrome/quinol oxidase subunit 4
MNMDSKDLLMINATIIAGLLILLTISSFSQTEFPNRSIFVTIAVTIVIIFSISCFMYLTDENKFGIVLSKMGFISIIFFMIFVGMVNVINIIDPTIWSEVPGASKIAMNNDTSSRK